MRTAAQGAPRTVSRATSRGPDFSTTGGRALSHSRQQRHSIPTQGPYMPRTRAGLCRLTVCGGGLLRTSHPQPTTSAHTSSAHTPQKRPTTRGHTTHHPTPTPPNPPHTATPTPHNHHPQPQTVTPRDLVCTVFSPRCAQVVDNLSPARTKHGAAFGFH